jgi:YD repeat-containing protein
LLLLLGAVVVPPAVAQAVPTDTSETYTVAYGYDAQGRLTQVEYTTSEGIAYEYDAAGNVLATAPVGVLPVELAAFNGTVDGRDVLLTWTTASETTNAGFEVQMQAPAGAAAPWETLGFVDGAGTTTEAQAYRYRVKDLAGGTYAFRLQQVDVDGSTTLSPMVTVAVGVPQAFALHGAYPNPSRATATIPFDVPRTAHVRLAVYDVLGRRAAVVADAEYAPGRHTAQLRTDRLSGGVYFYRIRMGDFQAARKLVVVP